MKGRAQTEEAGDTEAGLSTEGTIPVQLQGSETAVVRFSATLVRLSAERQVFLSYTAGRELGPGIERTGRSAEYMEWLGQRVYDRIQMRELSTWRVGDPSAANAFPLHQQPSPQNCDHCSYFRALTKGEWRIVAMQGCGNLSMNEWFVGYYNPPPEWGDPHRTQGLIYLAREAPKTSDRQYTCLVKWKGDREHPPVLSIQELQVRVAFPGYFALAEASSLPTSLSKRTGVSGIPPDGRLLNITDAVEFAFFGQQVISKGEPVALEQIADQFFDVRHLFRLPLLPESAYFEHPQPFQPWFGEAELLRRPEQRRRALGGPVLLECMDYAPGADAPTIRQAFLDSGYEAVTGPPERPGQFRLVPVSAPHQVDVWLIPNVYPYSFVGLAKPREEQLGEPALVYPSEALVLFAAGGKPGRCGLTLREAVEVLRTQIQTIPLRSGDQDVAYEVYDALLVDEGYDVFQFARDKDGKLEFKVPVGGSALPTEDPEPDTIGRDRSKAVLIVAEKRHESEGSGEQGQ